MTLRLYGFIPAGLSSTGCVALLLCSAAARQASPISSATSPGQPAAKVRRASASSASQKGRKSPKSASHRRRRGQEKIDPARAREIQSALIREHYLEGMASGTWDAASQKAMQRYQADNGWQSKTVPDSRALIKLGLGPDHEQLLNPESAMTAQPRALHSTPPSTPVPTSALPTGSSPQK
jgi:hypothetical protein